MLNPIFAMTGILVSAVLMTLVLLFVSRYLYLKRQLLWKRLTTPFHEDGNGSYDGRHYAYYLVYCHYVAKYAFIAYKWISQTLQICVRHPRDNSNHEGYETSSNGFVQLRHLTAYIGIIVNRLRRLVNQSGKEPFSLLALTFSCKA